MSENSAYVCKQTGATYVHSEVTDNFEELPDDIDDEEKYVQLPHKKELGLGKPLALDFASEFMPDCFDEVRRMFSRRGAYGAFKDLLIYRKGMLDQWHAFENEAGIRALRQWCEDNDIEIEG